MNKPLCKICGKTFKRTSNSQKYCSIKCRNKQYLPRVTEWHRQKRKKVASTPAENKLQCIICGGWYRQVSNHIYYAHKMTAREFRKKYGFDIKRGHLPEDLRELKSKYVFENGTVENLKVGAKYRYKKGQVGVGVYERSEETLERLAWIRKLAYKKKSNT